MNHAAWLLTVLIAGCGSPHTSPITTTITSAAPADDIHGVFPVTATANHAVEVLAQNSCAVKAQEEMWDSRAEVSLSAIKPGTQDTGAQLARGVLGIGWLQPDGTCEFRFTLDFPIPLTTPGGYLLAISPNGATYTATWKFDTRPVPGQRIQIELPVG